jgi:hypothetical protein
MREPDDPIQPLTGQWIEIHYKDANGVENSHYAMTDSQGCFFWNPPVPVTEVYFRIHNREVQNGCVKLPGELWRPLWTPDDVAPLRPVQMQGGRIEGYVFLSDALRLPATFEFKYLEPIHHEFPMIEEEEAPFRPHLRKKDSPVKTRNHGPVWRFFHPRKVPKF